MIPFSLDVYLRLIAQYNAAWWPGQIGALVAATVLIALCLRPVRQTGRVLTAALALSWAWIGIVYYGGTLASLSWAAWIMAAVFALQAALFAILSLRMSPEPGMQQSRTAIAMLVAAAALYPGADIALGGPLEAAPVVGLHPGPTLLFTLGAVLILRPTIAPRTLVLPLLAAAGIGIAGGMVGTTVDIVLLPAAILTVALRLRPAG